MHKFHCFRHDNNLPPENIRGTKGGRKKENERKFNRNDIATIVS